MKSPQIFPLQASAKPAIERITPQSVGNSISLLGCGSRSSVAKLAWFCVELHAQQTLLAIRNMKRQGFHTFVPLERVERPPPNGLGRPRTAPPTYKPLFWGYAFVHAPSYIEWHKLFSTYGVKRVFLNGDETPQRIPNEALVSLLYLSCQAPAGAPPLGINTKPVQPKPRLRILKPTWQPPATLAPQARARVAKEGHVLFGHEGLVKWTAKEKTKLLMAILGGEVEMLLDTDILAPV